MKKESFPSIKCTDIGFSDCSHISYGVIEETLLRNLKYHVIKSHGHTDQSSGKKSCRRGLKILEN